ncbi:uncharacterized protein SETTUDRAFT_158436 [Exserohilum turcica Et28A]|uniref:Phosphoglycerate mutase-like protein n=1 Tax=Exserohilum turcicum (strain 28A) TaxID=671987 RepID=R0J1V1_EXST2|nr:uncharacterized protein SETTUDRAFT_158436 [Exserohilum turcica Et28A]EOA90950.1 hypothetical protein SETTUDRAFT_158436 [Exserohilum turcica Et28A]
MAPRWIITTSAIVTAILAAAIYIVYHSPSLSALSPSLYASLSQYPGYLGSECAGKPHHASWESWWHPQHSTGNATAAKSKDGAAARTKDWNILYHLGGNGPWVEKKIDVVEGGVAVPEGCEVVQVHMMARHAERYRTRRAGHAQKSVVRRIKESGKVFDGRLSFFNDWELFWSSDDHLEQLTSTGPFAGTLGSFTTGVRLRTRYQHLIDKATANQEHPTIFWASDSNRVIETAKHFASGFFGLDYAAAKTASLSIISEHSSLGADTLTPGRTCLGNKKDKEHGQRKGYRLMAEYRASYMPPIRERLLAQTGMDFSDEEIYAMQEMCGFEITVRGHSNWCNVFTQEEFLSFEYARDLLHYYRAGPGQKYAKSMGWLWLNATTNLLVQGLEEAGPLFFSFVHDGDIAPMMSALDVINDAQHLPTTHIAHDRKWRKSQVSPMGGRVIFELLSCSSNGAAQDAPAKFIRLNINDGITALPDCNSGPGKGCPLADFAARTKRKGEEVEDFKELCGLPEDAAGRITFLSQKLAR